MKLRLRRQRNPASIAGDVDGQALHEELTTSTSLEVARQNAHLRAATKWGTVLMLFGAILVVGSALSAESWTEAGISLGTGSVLAGLVFILEPRFVRHIGAEAGRTASATATTTATDVATRVVDERTAEITERVELLERLQALQDKITADRRTAASDLVRRVREQPDFESTAELLEKAQDQLLFSSLRLRTGQDHGTLVSMTWETISPDVLRVMGEYIAGGEYFDADALVEDHILLHAFSVFGEGSSAASPWLATQTLTEAWNAFLDTCERERVPTLDLGLPAVFEALTTSYAVMTDSRQRAPSDPRRIRGRLILLVNDEWAITDEGLESRIDGVSPWTAKAEESCPGGHDEQLWQEAVTYWSAVKLTVSPEAPSDGFDEPF